MRKMEKRLDACNVHWSSFDTNDVQTPTVCIKDLDLTETVKEAI